jgi:biotin transport system permease protein
MIGIYVPGTSWLHRARPGVKLAGLTVLLLVLGVARTPETVGAGALLVAGFSLSSGVPAPVVGAQLRPVVPGLVVIAALQFWLAGPAAAAVVVGSIAVAVGAAALVTLTTRTTALLDALVTALRPARRIGVDPDRVALVLALAVRSVPVLAAFAREVREARAARGAERSLRGFAVPFVVRSLRYADQLGEALAARGADD